MKKFIIILVGGLLMISGALFSGGAYLYWSFKNSPGSNELTVKEVVYEVEQGRSFNQVSRDLEKQGIVKNAQLFSWYARLVGQRSKMKMGEYQFNSGMRPDQVLAVLISGKSIQRPFTIPEGYNLFEIAALVEKAGIGTAQDFAVLVTNKEFILSLLGEERDSLEGYLYPETYMLSKKDNAQTLVIAMVKAALKNYEAVRASGPVDPVAMGLTRHQVFTFASIVEKETGAKQERPLIASVFHNRLQKGMRLQTDPTVIYGKALINGKLEISITKADLLSPNPYNTYTENGLPPGPISNPGQEAISAVLRPAASSYLFFVSQNDGTHVFSENYKDHVNAVKKFQLDAKARAGKSWRDLKQ